MSVTNQHNEPNFVHNDYDLGKIFVWDNRYSQATFKNNTGAQATFAPGTVLGRDSADNTIVPLDPAVVTGGQAIPVGILSVEVTDIADAAILEKVTFATQGDVVEHKLIFQGGDKTSVIASGGDRSLEDLLRDIGIKLIPSDSLTQPDNA